MRTVKASEFKATCLRLMDEVAETGDPVVITKNGRPVSKLVPFREPLRSLWVLHAGRLELVDDLVEGTGEVWGTTYDSEGIPDGEDTFTCPDCRGAGFLPPAEKYTKPTTGH